MIKNLKNALKITNENIIIATPFVIFMLIFTVYVSFMGNSTTTVATIFSLITLLLMMSAFYAGWFYMVGKSIELSKKVFVMDDDRNKASLELLKEFPTGVGEYFFPFIGYCIFNFALTIFVMIGIYFIGLHLIGNPGVAPAMLSEAMKTPENLQKLINSLSNSQVIMLNMWFGLFIIIMVAYAFVNLLWVPQIIWKTKNPFIALFKSIANVFRKFWKTLGLFITLGIIYFAVTLLNTVCEINPILSFISSIIYFYFLVYIIVLIFLYYDNEFNEQQIEQKDESNSDCGTDSIGEDSESDTTGEEG